MIAHKDDQLVISYHLGLIGLLIFVSLVAGLIGLGLNTFMKMPTETSVSLACFSWVAVFGLNFISTVVDFHRFMAGQIRDFVNFAMGVGW